MSLYRITWEIDLDADTAEDAARTARAIQLDTASIANVFEVRDAQTGEVKLIDLDEPEDAN